MFCDRLYYILFDHFSPGDNTGFFHRFRIIKQIGVYKVITARIRAQKGLEACSYRQCKECPQSPEQVAEEEY